MGTGSVYMSSPCDSVETSCTLLREAVLWSLAGCLTPGGMPVPAWSYNPFLAARSI